jgi:hypothetical protein
VYFLKKIFSPVILTVSFFLLVYTFYKSEIINYGDQRDYYFTYYLISFLLIFFSIISFLINSKLKEYLIISTITLIISLYSFEGYLALKETKILPHKNHEKKQDKKWDPRTKLEIYQDLKKINNEIVVEVSPSSYLNKNQSIFPLSGISNSETIYCNENGYYSIYQSDKYGLNNPDYEWNENEIEYVLVGDSFAHGACVNRPNDIASVLRNLSNKSVLNFGYGGNGPLIEYATLREYLNKNVKKVIWIYYESNDFRDLYNEIGEKILMNYLDDLTFTQNLKFRQNEINNLALKAIKKKESDIKNENESETEYLKLKFIKFIKFIKIFRTRILIFPPPVPTMEFKKILQMTKDLTIKNNSKLYFVYLPSIWRYKMKKKPNDDLALVKNIVNELGIPFIDINKEVFEKEDNPLRLFPSEHYVHYNVEGYKKVGETIYEFSKD